MFCRYCGNELPNEAQFCNACGKPVDTGQPEQGTLQEPPQEESSSPEISAAADTIKRPVQKNGLKKAVIIAIIILGMVALSVLGMRAVNETSMKQQVPQGIYVESKDRVVNHYDKTMAYPYGNDLGYTYGCDFTTFEIIKGDKPNTFHVTGELEVIDKSQDNRPTYKIDVSGTVTTNLFRTDWSAEWDLSYQDPVYQATSYSDSSTPAISVNQFRSRLTSFNGEYIEPHIPSESGGFTEGSGHVEVTVNLEAVNDSKMNASISVLSFSDSARIAEVSASGEVELQPAITIEFEDDGWGNKGILHLLFLENGEIGIWSEITEYDEYANWELYIEYVELAMTSSGSDYNDNRLPTLAIDTSYPFGYYEKDGGGAIDIGYTTDEPSSIYFRFYKDRDESMYGNYWADQEPDYTTYFDWFDAGSYKTWNLTMDATSVQVEISEEYIVVTTDGPLGPLSANQASGIYYCKAQAIDPQ